MGGKSTYLRQTALLPVLAQMGSFVPARDAKLPIVDRIFARVGASDNIARGQSTFMVEMQETANILHTATVAQPGRARRDRPRHRDLRRPQHRLGRGRAPGQPPDRPAEDALRHALSRADRPGRRACPAWSTRTWPRASGRTTSCSCARSSRGAPIAATASRWRGWPACPRGVIARAKEILIGLERDELSRGGRPTHSADPDDRTRAAGALRRRRPTGRAGTRAESVLARLLALDLDDTTPRDGAGGAGRTAAPGGCR